MQLTWRTLTLAVLSTCCEGLEAIYELHNRQIAILLVRRGQLLLPHLTVMKFPLACMMPGVAKESGLRGMKGGVGEGIRQNVARLVQIDKRQSGVCHQQTRGKLPRSGSARRWNGIQTVVELLLTS